MVVLEVDGEIIVQGKPLLISIISRGKANFGVRKREKNR